MKISQSAIRARIVPPGNASLISARPQTIVVQGLVNTLAKQVNAGAETSAHLELPARKLSTGQSLKPKEQKLNLAPSAIRA